MTKPTAGAQPPPPSPSALPRKSLEYSYASTASDHRRSSSDAATPTQTTHLGRPLLQAVSIQDLTRTNGTNALSPVSKQQPTPQAPKHPPTRSLTDQGQSRSPGKGAPRNKTSNPNLHNLLGLQSSLNSKMHRLAPTTSISSTPSASTLSLPASTLASAFSSNSLGSLASIENPWQTLHVFVLPLFNGEQLGQPIEDLNNLVRQHIQAVVSRGFSRALSTIESDLIDLLTSGMLTLSAKLANLEEEKLLPRLIEIWILFYDQVLPYIEGVFLPVHTDGLIVSLNRPKMNRPPSPSLGEPSSRGSSSQQIDVRILTLRAFRDKVLLPIHHRLMPILSSGRRAAFHENVEHSQSRLRQMLLILVSTTRLGFFDVSMQPISEAQEAVLELLRTANQASGKSTNQIEEHTQKLPSFLSAGNPRDRRGRMARKSVHQHDTESSQYPQHLILERKRALADLATIRSPNPGGSKEKDGGGWGLGVGQEVSARYENGEEGKEELADELASIKNDFGQNDFGILGLRAAEAAQDGRSLRRKGSQS